MTAVVGILNKHGIAIAADSAVTVSGTRGRKVYNYANKIFALSKHHPVGIAVYNNAQFMGIPWEVVVKEYRRQLGTKAFESLADYQTDFFRWLKANGYFLGEQANDYVFLDYLEFVRAFISNTISTNQLKPENLNKNLGALLNLYCSEEIPKHTKNHNLAELKIENVHSLLTSMTPKVIEYINQAFKSRINWKDVSESAVNAYFSYLTHDQFVQFSGLVFFGFGDKEIFPGLLPVNVSIVLDGMLRYLEDKQKAAKINDAENAVIAPFAQTDVIDTVLSGISPEIDKLYSQTFGSLLEDVLKTKLPELPEMPESVKARLKEINIDEIVAKYNDSLTNIIREKNVVPLMNAVSQLSKEDLAEMSESLVYLTYLKRRFTLAEESVGGPVDVAVVTKGDGFIWIKRKHYFDAKLNQGFFQKYF